MKCLSVLVLTQDNADTLAPVLASVAFADEIVVVDSGSTDGTLEIARAAGARIVQRAFTDFADQRNAGWAVAEGRWVLALDSDEMLDGQARDAIRRVSAGEPGPGEPVAYGICRVPYFLGRALKHGGVMETFTLRLALRVRSRWQGRIHEALVVDGPTANLPGLIEHDTSPTLVGRLQKVVAYAVARAQEWRAQGVRPSAGAVVWQPLRFFVGRVTVRGGFRDGVLGVVWWWLLATELMLAHLLLLLPEAVSARERSELGSATGGRPRPSASAAATAAATRDPGR